MHIQPWILITNANNNQVPYIVATNRTVMQMYQFYSVLSVFFRFSNIDNYKLFASKVAFIYQV